MRPALEPVELRQRDGVERRARTPGLRVRSAALFRLSYLDRHGPRAGNRTRVFTLAACRPAIERHGDGTTGRTRTCVSGFGVRGPGCWTTVVETSAIALTLRLSAGLPVA